MARQHLQFMEQWQHDGNDGNGWHNGDGDGDGNGRHSGNSGVRWDGNAGVAMTMDDTTTTQW